MISLMSKLFVVTFLYSQPISAISVTILLTGSLTLMYNLRMAGTSPLNCNRLPWMFCIANISSRRISFSDADCSGLPLILMMDSLSGSIFSLLKSSCLKVVVVKSSWCFLLICVWRKLLSNDTVDELRFCASDNFNSSLIAAPFSFKDLELLTLWSKSWHFNTVLLSPL